MYYPTMQALTEAERLQLLIDKLCHGNQAKFSRIADMNPSTVSHILAGRKGYGLSPNTIAKIVTAFPQVSTEFLKDGLSDPGDLDGNQKTNRLQTLLDEKSALVDELLKIVSSQQQTIQILTTKIGAPKD